MLIYIHGFASSANSNKVRLLKKRFPNMIAFDLNVSPKEAISQLDFFISKHLDKENITLIGSSLGGFYAMYFSQKYALKVILINPSIYPEKTLVCYKDKQVTNYSKENETFIFKAEYIEELKIFKTVNVDHSKVLLLLQKGDQTIDYKEALGFLPNAMSVVESAGTHQFENIEHYFDKIDFFQNKK